jgi:hypothetical protein
MNIVHRTPAELAERDAAALTRELAAGLVHTGATKAQTIGYWVTTGLLVFCMTGGIFELLGMHTTKDGLMRLGYPSYILPALGLGKILAILALLWPGLPRLKEWAYAGIFFNMLGAVVSHVACHDPAWSIVVTATIAALTLVSWALRPHSRRLGELTNHAR